jgi:cystathionine beta-lyase/cystathionine gamma-synthase
MAAMTTLLCVLKTGDKVLSVDDVYGGVQRLLTKVTVPQWGLQYAQTDMSDFKELEELLTENVKMIWIESPTNPTLRVVDIASIVTHVKNKNPNCLVIVDNTFATPYLQRPLQMGADVVVHSVTKYIGGHSDVLMGAIVTNNEQIADKISFLQLAIGAVASPFDCFMALRGLKSLSVRMRQHCEGAMKVALYLSKHERVSQVFYPGLPSHPQHEIARKQMTRGFGGVVSFKLKAANLKITVRLTTSCQILTLAESLGGVESLIEVPSIMTHASLSPDSLSRLGIDDCMLRISVGIEDPDDIISDLDRALRIAFSNCDV